MVKVEKMSDKFMMVVIFVRKMMVMLIFVVMIKMISVDEVKKLIDIVFK